MRKIATLTSVGANIFFSFRRNIADCKDATVKWSSKKVRFLALAGSEDSIFLIVIRKSFEPWSPKKEAFAQVMRSYHTDPSDPNALPAEFRVLLSENGIHKDYDICTFPGSLSGFMSSNPGASYTSFVSTNNSAQVFNLEFHCYRLLAGLAALEETSGLLSCLELKTILKTSIASIVRLSSVKSNEEIQFVVILHRTERKLYLRIHATPVGSMQRVDLVAYEPVAVECRRGQRRRPRVKDTSWYRDRIPFENIRNGVAKETILVGEFGQDELVLLEGLVTNFFVVTKTLEVWTAGEGFVLSGSMRDLVLRACEELRITVVQKAISLDSWRNFEAAFLTNARRILQPVSEIFVPKSIHDGHPDIPNVIRLPVESAGSHMVKELQQRVAMIIQCIAEDIPNP